VTKTDGTVVEHVYDFDGNRVQTTTTPAGGSSAVTNFLVDTSGTLSHVVAETDGTGALVAHYVRGDDLLAVMRPNGSGGWVSRFYHSDHIGSVRRLTDEAGLVTDGYTYDAFGTLLAHTGSDPQPYAFTGEPYDPNVGFQYHRARWMDPRVGRFVGMDPFGGRSPDPMSLHRYLYAHLDAVRRVDPSGRMTVVEGLMVAGIGAVIGAISTATYNYAVGEAQTVWSIASGAALGAILAPAAVAAPVVGLGLAGGGLVVALGTVSVVLSNPNATPGQKLAAMTLLVAAMYGGSRAWTYHRSGGSAPLDLIPAGAPEPLPPPPLLSLGAGKHNVPAGSLRGGARGMLDPVRLAQARELLSSGGNTSNVGEGPIIVSRNGSIINGHHRARAAAELGIDVEVVVSDIPMEPGVPIGLMSIIGE
jgi:RHS repeat-associated protein